MAGRTIWIDKNGIEISDEQDKAIKLKVRLARFSYIAPTADENGLRLAIAKPHDVTYYSFLNADNIEIIGGHIDYKPPSEGYYAVSYISGKGHPYWIFVDKNGTKMIDEIYWDVLSTFKNGVAKVVLRKEYTDGATVWIDKKGNQMTQSELDSKNN